MKINWDKLCGWSLGVVFVMVVGKCWIVPDMSIWEILRIIVENQIGW